MNITEPELQLSLAQLTNVTSDCVQGLLIASERAKLLTNAIEGFTGSTNGLRDATLAGATIVRKESEALTEALHTSASAQTSAVTSTIRQLEASLTQIEKDNAATLKAVRNQLASLESVQERFASVQKDTLARIRWENRILWLVLTVLFVLVSFSHLVHL